MEVALYKGVKQVRGATKQQFEKAVYSNLFWDNFSDKKATFGKMLAFMIVMLLVFMTTIVIFAAAIPGTIDSFIKQEAFDSRFWQTSFQLFLICCYSKTIPSAGC